MSLSKYKEKRSFNKTPEPTGGKPSDDQLHFVVQKHAASHLHYDFRLELKGVLKSWAVPKGPSVNPDERRLAMMTEDHPYDYKDFEGLIPKGQYGGGTVIIWDEGTFTTPDAAKDKRSQEHELASQFYKGAILVEMNGHKLKGKYALIKDKSKGDNTWYLIKVKDKYASKKDITTKDSSVISGLTIEGMEQNPKAKKWQSNREENKEELNVTHISDHLKTAGKKINMPSEISPMNATLVKEICNSSDWLYEVKWDGYRVISFIKDGKIKLQSRGGLDYTKKYETLTHELKTISHDAVLDGEVVVLNEHGKPDFDALQKYKPDMQLVYYVFDLIWLDGYDLTRMALSDRKSLLRQIIPESDIVKYSDHFDDGEQLFEQMKNLQLEGIVAKKRNSFYYTGARSKDWLKVPIVKRQEFVIGGWTESDSGRPFRSLLFGEYDSGKLMFVGHAGGGFTDVQMKGIIEKLKKIEVKKKPFANAVDHSTTPHWVRPELVANFKFATWTAAGKIRKPATFLGFRDDKDPKEVKREVPLSTKEEKKIISTEVMAEEKTISKSKPKTDKAHAQTSAESNWPEIESIPITSSNDFTIEGNTVTLTNVEKELWKGITKADLIQYYHEVSEYILPHLNNRPLSLHIKHQSPTAPGLYIKDMENRQPEWAEIFSIKRKHLKKGRRDVIDYLVCNNEATLLYMINLGCIDINPTTSCTDDYLHPDFIIIDLDPSDEDFKKVIATAKAAKKFFDKNKIKSFPKTSGKTGLHIFIPCTGFNFSEARTIAENICSEIHKMVPDITTTEVTVSKRGDKLYLDPNQNDEADTIAAPYCARPFHHPYVSAPLEWKEINEKLKPSLFTIDTMNKRLKKKGDLFSGIFNNSHKRSNSALLRKFL